MTTLEKADQQQVNKVKGKAKTGQLDIKKDPFGTVTLKRHEAHRVVTINIMPGDETEQVRQVINSGEVK